MNKHHIMDNDKYCQPICGTFIKDKCGAMYGWLIATERKKLNCKKCLKLLKTKKGQE